MAEVKPPEVGEITWADLTVPDAGAVCALFQGTSAS